MIVIAIQFAILIFSLKNKVPNVIVRIGVARNRMLDIRGLVTCNPKKLNSKAKNIMKAMSIVVGKYFIRFNFISAFFIVNFEKQKAQIKTTNS